MFNLVIRKIASTNQDGDEPSNKNSAIRADAHRLGSVEPECVLASNPPGTHIVIYDPEHTYVVSPAGDYWNIVQCSPGDATFLPNDIKEDRRQAIAPGSTLTVCMRGEVSTTLSKHPRTIGRGRHRYELSVTPVRRWCSIQ